MAVRHPGPPLLGRVVVNRAGGGDGVREQLDADERNSGIRPVTRLNIFNAVDQPRKQDTVRIAAVNPAVDTVGLKIVDQCRYQHFQSGYHKIMPVAAADMVARRSSGT